jgi:hypothetical protein
VDIIPSDSDPIRLAAALRRPEYVAPDKNGRGRASRHISKLGLPHKCALIRNTYCV